MKTDSRPTAWTRLRLTLEMIRFSHTLFALPFAMLSAALAWNLREDPWPRWQELVGIVQCMATARSAAMAFNRLVDRRIDAKNPRTAGRHLPAGTLTVAGVTWFAVLSGFAFIASTFLFWPNPWPPILGLPVLAFLLGYSFVKRFSSLAHFWLGAALAAAPLAAWIAIQGMHGLATPAVLAVAVLLWVAGFDIIYACQDYQFDVDSGLHSVPAKLGVAKALWLAAACHLGMVAFLALLPLFSPALGWIYGGGVLVVAALIAYEHSLVRADDLTRVNQAFFHVNAVVSVGLFVVTLVELAV